MMQDFTDTSPLHIFPRSLFAINKTIFLSLSGILCPQRR